MTSSEYFTGCIISLFVHEIGHICAALMLGVRVKKVGIALRGPYIVRETGSTIENAVISAAGPFVNLVLAATTWQVWPALSLINLVLGLANLYPTPTSDGRRVFQGLSTVFGWTGKTAGIAHTPAIASPPVGPAIQ